MREKFKGMSAAVCIGILLALLALTGTSGSAVVSAVNSVNPSLTSVDSAGRISGSTIHFFNNTRQNVYVFVSLKPEWLLHDALANAALSILGLKNIPKAYLSFSGLKKSLTSLNQLRKLYGTQKASGEVAKAVEEAAVREFGYKLFDGFKKISTKVSPGEAVPVFRSSLWNLFSVEGLKDLQNAKIRTLLVVAEDRKKSAEFSTGADDSWVSNEQGIYLAKRGTLQEIDSSNYDMALQSKAGPQCLRHGPPSYIRTLQGVVAGVCSSEKEQSWSAPNGLAGPFKAAPKRDQCLTAGEVRKSRKGVIFGKVWLESCKKDNEAQKKGGQWWGLLSDGRMMNIGLGEGSGCLYLGGHTGKKGKVFYAIYVKKCSGYPPFLWRLDKFNPWPYDWETGSPFGE
ncbi:hypothetical protein [Streptomyces aureoversilis]|uniref:Uncharacterized protein n=1 Tax=Streptomyces aureoversilis TaxID=67277 RepID=A0ABW0AB49_9ACTN